VDTYSKVAHCKLYTTKTPITAADILNDKVLPFYEANELPVLRILTDRGTEYCGKVEQHDYQLYLAINDIDHTKTKARHPQTNGICERFHLCPVGIKPYCKSSIRLPSAKSFIMT
jgi:transposase InsO family protein